MLNNKGQSLVLFVIILPVLMFLLVLIIDVGKVIVLKQELSNISEIVIDYGIDKMDEDNIIDELNEIILLNKNDIDNIDIYIDDEKIYVKLYDRCETVFSSFINVSFYDINVSYVGYIENNKKRIESLGD